MDLQKGKITDGANIKIGLSDPLFLIKHTCTRTILSGFCSLFGNNYLFHADIYTEMALCALSLREHM